MAADTIVCADWSKYPRNRRVRLADPVERRISRPQAGEWSVQETLDLALTNRRRGFALVAFDAPIGVPSSYFDAARPMFGVPRAATFLEWLPKALARHDFLNPVLRANDWSPLRPFFKVPKGRGSLSAFVAAARASGVELKRKIETATRGNSVFALDLPGQVAPAAQALWKELATAGAVPHVALWPFDGPLRSLTKESSITIAEIYPRAAYGSALAATLPAKPRSLGKTKQAVRSAAVKELQHSSWVRRWNVQIDHASTAIVDDGDFDALMTAAALLRFTLEEKPLSTFKVDPVAEGAMLCA